MEVFLLLLFVSLSTADKLDLVLHLDHKKYVDAKNKCRKENKSLFLPKNLEIIKQLRENLELSINNPMWIGLLKTTKSGKSTWYFADGKKVPDNFEFWDVNQPTSDGDCAVMDGQNKMETRSLKTKLSFVCEKKISSKQKCDNAKDMWKYDNKCLSVIHEPAYCSTAKSRCKRIGGTLVIVKTKEEFEDVQKEIRSATMDKQIWAGLEKINGKWTFQDGAEAIDIEKMWLEGLKIDRNSKCAMVSTRSDRLLPVKCTQVGYPVCQNVTRILRSSPSSLAKSNLYNSKV